MTTVHEAWNDVMRDLREIRKDERASGGGANYNFRGIDAVMNAVGPIFRDHRVSCVPIEIKNFQHRDFTSKNGTRMHEVILTVRYEVTGPDGDKFQGESIGESSDSSDKATSQAMSVALRTFLLQGLTMPTDAPEPDQSWTDREANDHIDQGWGSAEQREAEFAALAARAKALPDDNPSKDSMRSWLKSSGINPKTLTTEQANTWLASLEEAEEVGAPEADDGWKSAAECTRTMKSLMERIANLPAFESEQVNAEMVRIGIDGEAKPTKAQAKELLAAIAEAEELAKATKP